MEADKPEPKYSNVQVQYRIWMEDPGGTHILDDNHWKLLQAIGQTRSLKTASGIMGVSYRKSWGDLKMIENMLGFSLIEKHRGGVQGGETVLTAEGERFVDIYGQFLKNFSEAGNQAIIRLKRELKGKKPKEIRQRRK